MAIEVTSGNSTLIQSQVANLLVQPLEQASTFLAAGPVVHIEGQVLPVQTVLGYGHAMQDLQALALAALAQTQARVQTAGAGARRSPAVHAELGPQARLVLQAAGQPLPRQLQPGACSRP